jgi:predicted phage-related endonuclease
MLFSESTERRLRSIGGRLDGQTTESAMLERSKNHTDRRQFIGGSDARIIMGQDEKALIRLWQEKRGEIGPEDLSGNLIVELGLVTEDLNRQWYERNTPRPSRTCSPG